MARPELALATQTTFTSPGRISIRGSRLRWRELGCSRLGRRELGDSRLEWRELGSSRLGWRELGGSRSEEQDAVPDGQMHATTGYRDLRKPGGSRLKRREHGD